MKRRAFRKYKPSDVVWLGKIPGEWEKRRLKTSIRRNDGGVWGQDFDSNGTIVLRSTEQTVDGRWQIKEPAQRLLSPSETASALLAEGDLVITKSSGSEQHIGKTTVVDSVVASLGCCFSNFMQRLRCNGQTYPKFLYYVLNSPVGREQFVFGSSTTTGLANLNGEIIGNVWVSFPLLDEQRTIAAFLDRETAHNDKLIAKKQRQIELLQEKRAALISHAVTKGLDPNVQMKDSGIEWLGDVPEHWEIKRLRFVAELNPVKSEVSHLLPDMEVSFVPMEAVSEFGGLQLDQIRVIDDVYQGYTYFRNGDIVIAKITPCFENGKGSIAEGLTNNVGFGTTELHVVRPGKKLDRCFFFFLSISTPFRQPGEAEMYGAGGQKRVPDSFIRNYRIPLPPLTEQQQIVKHLEAEWIRIDAFSKQVKESIDLLCEYRMALISAAVTGKIDVREVSPNAI